MTKHTYWAGLGVLMTLGVVALILTFIAGLPVWTGWVLVALVLSWVLFYEQARKRTSTNQED